MSDNKQTDPPRHQQLALRTWLKIMAMLVGIYAFGLLVFWLRKYAH
jgi:uncharacterized membrane protein (Fun14 family)